jgi:hypothetical protein
MQEIKTAFAQSHALFSNLFDDLGPLDTPAVAVDKDDLGLVVVFMGKMTESAEAIVRKDARELGVSLKAVIGDNGSYEYANAAKEPPMNLGLAEHTAPQPYGFTK